MIALLHRTYCTARIGGYFSVRGSSNLFLVYGSRGPYGVYGSCGCAAFRIAVEVTHETIFLFKIAVIALATHEDAHGVV